jgi:hypothetical protein
MQALSFFSNLTANFAVTKILDASVSEEEAWVCLFEIHFFDKTENAHDITREWMSKWV